MKYFLSAILFVTSVSLVEAQTIINENIDKTILVYHDLSFKRKKQYAAQRFHINYNPINGLYLEITNTGKLPAYYRKFVTTNNGDKSRESFSRKDVIDFSFPLIDSQVTAIYNDTIFFTNKAKKEKLKTTWQRNTQRYYTGKQAGDFFTHNWIPIHTMPGSDFTLNIKGIIFKKAQYKTDEIPIGFAPLLPALDTAQCLPFNRFHELRKMKGYGIDKFNYILYRMPSRQTVRQQFEIYFDKNSYDAKPESVQAVIDYLRNNNYSILNATIEGYSSIEGDDQQNTRLQQKRARVLFNLLQKYNSEPIIRDTVIINPGFELFRQTIKQTPYQWLDSLSNERMGATINSNQILLSAIEPYLKTQRKAVLKLVVAKRIEGAEMLERFRKDFTFLEMQLDPERSKGLPPADVESRLMGMIAYLFNLVENNFISADEAAELIDNALNNKMVRVLAVYHHIIQFEKKSYRDSLAWDDLSNKYRYNQLFPIAQTNLINLISDPIYYKQRDKFKRQLVDIQTYSFDYTLMNCISPATLCEMEYPDRPDFRGYKLNQLAFLQYLTSFREVPCEKLTIANQPEFKRYTDHWLDEVQKSIKKTDTTLLILESNDGQELKVKSVDDIPILFTRTPDGRYYPSYGKEVYSPLLFYLKKLFVKDEKSITQHMTVSDNLTEFDVLTLAQYHVSAWDPFKNYFIDREVQMIEMDKVIGLLKRINTRICPQVANQLYLDYHLKALHYINRYFEPGNSQQSAIAQRSLQFITNYYSKHAGLVTPRLSMYILLQLNAFHSLPGKYDGTWYAWNFLKSITAKHDLSEGEMLLFRKYEKYYRGEKL